MVVYTSNHVRILLLLMSVFPCFLHAQVGKALVITIGQYPEDGGWSTIHGDNDQQIVLPMLLSLGYAKTNIHMLTNQEATKVNIHVAFERLARQTAPGDHIYVHFSCHGQQMADDNGDEEDGLDEALIPYDAQRRYVKGRYEGENHVRDDELGVWINTIRFKAGPTGNVIVVLDACHSGTGTREEEDVYVRGTSYIFAPPGYILGHEVNYSTLKLAMTTHKTLSPVTVLSACSADQRNYEYFDASRQTYYGSLSYVLGKILVQSQVYSGTEFADILCKEMQTLFVGKRWTQVPVLESTNPNDTLITRIVNYGK